MFKIYNEDCLIALKNIPDESVDLIVTDCPYHIVGGGCSKGYQLEGTKHISLFGILNDNNATTYARQGKLFKHNDIDFSDWLPELYRVLKPAKHIYIYIYLQGI